MVKWNNDPEVEYYTGYGLPKTLSECEIWFNRHVPGHDCRLYAIEAAGARLIGDLELDHISWRNREAEFRIRIGVKEYWDQGYGTDAVRTLLALALGRLGLRRVYLRVYCFNRRAIRCYEKCGFRKEGVLRRKGNNNWQDILLMTKTISDSQDRIAAAGEEESLGASTKRSLVQRRRKYI